MFRLISPIAITMTIHSRREPDDRISEVPGFREAKSISRPTGKLIVSSRNAHKYRAIRAIRYSMENFDGGTENSSRDRVTLPSRCIYPSEPARETAGPPRRREFIGYIHDGPTRMSLSEGDRFPERFPSASTLRTIDIIARYVVNSVRTNDRLAIY